MTLAELLVPIKAAWSLPSSAGQGRKNEIKGSRVNPFSYSSLPAADVQVFSPLFKTLSQTESPNLPLLP